MSVGVTSQVDTAVRLAAFEHVRLLRGLHHPLPGRLLQAGFRLGGKQIHLVNPRGIFKPRQMDHVLSIRTPFPEPGKKVHYEDQLTAHRQIFENEEAVDYSFMGTDPSAAENQWLRTAFEKEIPVIYFLGVAPRHYEALMPTFIRGWDASSLNVKLVFGLPDQDGPKVPQNGVERRYALRIVKQRLHQTTFREAVIAAYDGRCAVSGLPERQLLDAAHIVADKNELLGQPVVPNGMPLSKLHHAAFDRHLIGVDPDYRLHVSQRLLGKKDGPILEALKKLDGGRIRLPDYESHLPDRDRLAQRFDLFKAAA